MHRHTFQMSTIKTGTVQLIKQDYYAFSIDFQDAYLNIPIVIIFMPFCDLFDKINLINEKFCHLDFLQPLWILTSLTKPILVLCCHSKWSFALLSIWMISWVPDVTLSIPGKRAWSFFLDCIFLFPSLNFISLSASCFFRFVFWDSCVYLCHLIRQMRL